MTREQRRIERQGMLDMEAHLKTLAFYTACNGKPHRGFPTRAAAAKFIATSRDETRNDQRFAGDVWTIVQARP